MVTDKIKQLEAAKAHLAKLEKHIAAKIHRELASLPAQYGYGSVKLFLKAVVAAAGGGKGAAGRGTGNAAKAGGSRKRRKRAVITDATRAQVKKLVEAGKTGSAIAKELHISLPSVQNIKKALGLVKARS